MPYKTPEREREVKRDYMRRQRASNPSKIAHWNSLRREAWSEHWKPRMQSYLANLREQHFFKWRARLASRDGLSVTAIQLASLWRRQRGRCAMSGRKLDRDAQLDHIDAVARGGAHELVNLQWLAKEVNLAKRELSVAEFIALCRDVVMTADIKCRS